MSASQLASVQSVIGFAQWLSHEHLIKLYGHWEDEESLFLVEEYAFGGDLFQVRHFRIFQLFNPFVTLPRDPEFLAQGYLSNPDRFTEKFVARKVVEPLLNVLAYMHGQSIVHRYVFVCNGCTVDFLPSSLPVCASQGHSTWAPDVREESQPQSWPLLRCFPSQYRQRHEQDGSAGLHGTRDACVRGRIQE